ncbi:MAG: PAS domain S-box protein, partial [Methylomonas sp.]
MSRQRSNFRDVIVESVVFLDSLDPPRWKGRLQLPGAHRALDILIFNIQGEYKAVPTFCPHQGYDLTRCPLSNGSSLICPAHGLCIDLKIAEFRVQERDGQFLVSSNEISQIEDKNISGGTDSETVLRLREEIEKLRLANLKQERQIHVITQSMDAMLNESEQQKVKLQHRVNQQQDLSRFIDRVLDTMDDLLFVIDTEGRIRQLNTGVERDLGFTEVELLGTGIDDLLSPAEQQHLAGCLPALPWHVHSVLMENVRLKGYYAGEHELLGKNPDSAKAIYWLKGSLLHSEQGKLEGAVVTALNITELKNRETRLRLSAKVFDNSSEAIFITDPKGTIMEVNSAFCEITGYQRDEVLGRNPRMLKSNLHDRSFYKNLWHSLLNE